MKKGIVMEQHRKYIIVMTHDGLFEKAHPIKDVSIGFEVEYEPIIQNNWFSGFKEKFLTMRVASIAVVFLIMLLPIYMVVNGNETYAYVDIDINPSIELEINNDLKVSKLIPLNDDANSLLDDIGNLKGMEVENAIEVIMNQSEKNGLVNAVKNVLIGVHYVKSQKDEHVLDVIEEHFAKKPTDWEVVTVTIPEEVRITAEEKKLSMNEALAQKVNEQPDEDIKSIVTEEDSEVLQSFFHNKKTSAEVTDQNSSENHNENEISHNEPKPHNKKDELHPSNQKGKNNSANPGNGQDKEKGLNKDNKMDLLEKSSYGKEKKNDYPKHDKKKHNEIKNKNKNEFKNHNQNNGKGPDKQDKPDKNNNKHPNKDKSKHEFDGNNGKGPDKHIQRGKGNQHDDDYSLGVPQYK
ncbi:hypothetical protein [Ornithinibacillus sp. 179-J 7C1 HS]|uniref:anti-sigma-I factor RsgI family protein n=1 Tax=Ornithinibacillus sp. 179-J 7C1 HS TaxID=3142384 RepID=UPI00399F2723